jgi:ureidoglycolate lyase
VACLKKLSVHKLTKSAFEPYGEVIMPGEEAPDITNEQIDYWDSIADITSLDGMGSLGFLSVKKTSVELKNMVKLFDSTESYITLDGSSSIEFVALDKGGKPDESSLKAFLLEGGQGVVVAKNVWHCTPFAMTDKTDFALILKNNIIVAQQDGSFGLDFENIVYEDLSETYTAE